jgi:hypothetical protein
MTLDTIGIFHLVVSPTPVKKYKTRCTRARTICMYTVRLHVLSIWPINCLINARGGVAHRGCSCAAHVRHTSIGIVFSRAQPVPVVTRGSAHQYAHMRVHIIQGSPLKTDGFEKEKKKWRKKLNKSIGFTVFARFWNECSSCIHVHYNIRGGLFHGCTWQTVYATPQEIIKYPLRCDIMTSSDFWRIRTTYSQYILSSADLLHSCYSFLSGTDENGNGFIFLVSGTSIPIDPSESVLCIVI